MSNNVRILILVRLSIGVIFFGVCGFCCYGFCAAKAEPIILATSAGVVATFVCGLYYVNTALDVRLWDPPPPPDRRRGDEGVHWDPNETTYTSYPPR